MEPLKEDPGSFRDKTGKIYISNSKIYRVINETGKKEFEFVQASGLLDILEKQNKVVSSQIVTNSVTSSVTSPNGLVIEHSKIPFISYPYEWSFSRLKAAALLHLEIQQIALEYEVVLSDASAYNVQFLGSSPIFIDILSFRQYREGEIWKGHKQFCEQFLNPLLLKFKLNVDFNAWYRGTQEGISTKDLNALLPWHKIFNWNLLTHVVLQTKLQNMDISKNSDQLNSLMFPKQRYMAMLKKLHIWVENLHLPAKEKTEWENYADTHSYDSQEVKSKELFIESFVKQIKAKTIWDIGCNTGHYSHTALKSGADNLIGFDFDQGALELAYKRSCENSSGFLPLFFDGANPSPGQGWNNKERQSLITRRNADGMFALAFIHHLAIGRNIPLKGLIEWLVSLAPQGVIEFVPKTDPMVGRLLQLREDIFDDYDRQSFISYLGDCAHIVRSEVVSKTGRELFQYSKTC